jgi:predicted dehydrogenase
MSAVPRLETSRVRLGFLGLGWIGRKRLDSIAGEQNVEIVALADASEEKLVAAAKAYPQALRVDSLNDLLAAGVDGVVIATPNGAHAQQALSCLSAGIAVFCQKPLATNAAAAQQVIDAARSHDRLLGIDFCYRHVNGMAELKNRIVSGSFGEITSLDLKFHNAYGPDKQWCFDRAASGGGCMLDLGVHLLDLALWLQEFPSMRLVSSHRFTQGRRAGQDDIEDQAYAELEQSNGAVVRLTSSWYAQIGCDAVIEATILGTKGGAVWRNVNGSFYDFEIFASRGSQRELLSSGVDDWGPRALAAWSQQLAHDRSFDPAALAIARSAELIDAIYAA